MQRPGNARTCAGPSILGLSLLLLLRTSTGSAAEVRTSTIDGSLALGHVEKLVSFGPRPPGSLGISRAQSYITETLKTLNLQVEHQEFLADTPNGKIPMKNILARTSRQADRIILLASHYDTRLAQQYRFVGANDGGSSSGLLLELARVLGQRPSNCAMWFVFFDGEEAQREWSETDSLYGSRYLAEDLKAKGMVDRIKAMILLDMVGDKDLVLEKDLSSTPWLVDLFLKSAQELGYARHTSRTPKAMVDDHIPFIRAGIPSVDLIDYEFGFNGIYWHTSNDTMDKLSARSLQIVGEIVVQMVDKLCRK